MIATNKSSTWIPKSSVREKRLDGMREYYDGYPTCWRLPIIFPKLVDRKLCVVSPLLEHDARGSGLKNLRRLTTLQIDFVMVASLGAFDHGDDGGNNKAYEWFCRPY